MHERFGETGIDTRFILSLFFLLFFVKKKKKKKKNPIGLETLVSLLSSNRQLWDDPKLRLDKTIWPKLISWIGSSGVGRDLAFVLPLLATAPSPTSFGPSLSKFVDSLFAAFMKAADANKVRSLAAEVSFLGEWMLCFSFKKQYFIFYWKRFLVT